MKYLAAILYLVSSIFVWFFVGALLFQVNPKLAMIIITLLLVKQVTSVYLTALQVQTLKEK